MKIKLKNNNIVFFNHNNSKKKTKNINIKNIVIIDDVSNDLDSDNYSDSDSDLLNKRIKDNAYEYYKRWYNKI